MSVQYQQTNRSTLGFTVSHRSFLTPFYRWRLPWAGAIKKYKKNPSNKAWAQRRTNANTVHHLTLRFLLLRWRVASLNSTIVAFPPSLPSLLTISSPFSPCSKQARKKSEPNPSCDVLYDCWHWYWISARLQLDGRSHHMSPPSPPTLPFSSCSFALLFHCRSVEPHSTVLMYAMPLALPPKQRGVIYA